MTDPELRLAATAVLLRDTEQGLEVLLLRRNAKLAFAAGAWGGDAPAGTRARREMGGRRRRRRRRRASHVTVDANARALV